MLILPTWPSRLLTKRHPRSDVFTMRCFSSSAAILSLKDWAAERTNATALFIWGRLWMTWPPKEIATTKCVTMSANLMLCSIAHLDIGLV